MSEERFYSVEEVAARLMVDNQTVRRWIKSGKLAAYKPGLEWRIHQDDLQAFLEARRPTTLPKARLPSLDELAKEAGHELGWVMASDTAFDDAFKGNTEEEVLDKAQRVAEQVRAEQRDFMALLNPIIHSTPFSEVNERHIKELTNRINERLVQAHIRAHDAAHQAGDEAAAEKAQRALVEAVSSTR